ncbi:MAG: prolipoprotein diacylglyceryl transferase [Deltaproteobacteria bacterium]|nr:prolipoprotein diacylglyceryl transferase [Deltaproteobacteria bacterium]
MQPVVTVLHLGSVERPLGGYGLMLALAILVAGLFTARAAHRAALDVGAAIACIGFTAAGSLAGATGLFALVEWARTGDPLAGVTGGSGLVFFGAPVGGGLALYYAARALGLPLGRFVDVSIAAVPLGHAIGRIGCFLGGCCYGRPWEGAFAVRYTDPMAPAAWPSVLRHPTPLYESALLLLVAGAFILIPPRHVGSGRRAILYFVVYGFVRLVAEYFRGDAVRGLFFGGHISTSQLISVVLILGGLGLLWAPRFRSRGAVTP